MKLILKEELYEKFLFKKPIKGNNLHLTINLKMQDFAQSLLPLTNKGSIVVLNCQDGSILSMNSNPTFNSQILRIEII